jgi:hypothetical protein
MKKEIIYYVVALVLIVILINEITISFEEEKLIKREGKRKKRVSQAHDWINRKERYIEPNEQFLEPEIADNPNGSGNWEADTPIEEIEEFLRQRAQWLEENNEAVNYNGEYPEHIQDDLNN